MGSIRAGERRGCNYRYGVGMAEQLRGTKSSAKANASSSESATVGSVARDSADRLSDEIDVLLDEIDDVLEQNAEEFVKNYVQKGGQ